MKIIMKTIPLILSLTTLAFASVTHAQVTQKEQKARTPDQTLENLMAGNARFVAGKTSEDDFTARIAATKKGQFPKAVILSCLDSRVPVELIFDQGIGDIFAGRVAGNIQNESQKY